MAGIPGVISPPLTADMLVEEFRVIVSEGLAPSAAMLTSKGAVAVDAPIRKVLSRVALAQHARTLAAEVVVPSLVEQLIDADIPFVIIKGPAVARLYPAGWARTFNDIDVLVQPRQFERAMALLLRRGYVYPSTSLPAHAWFDRFCREGLNLIGAGNVDLHHHVAPWHFGMGLRSRKVVDQAVRIELGGTPAPVASPEHSAVIAALHILNDLWKGGRGLASWRDLVLIIRRLGSSRVRGAFEESLLPWLFDLLVTTVRVHLPGLLDEIDPVAPKVPARDEWRMRGLGWGRSTSISRHRITWALRLPLPQAGAFLLGSALPSKQYIERRHGSYRGYWRQAWSETISISRAKTTAWTRGRRGLKGQRARRSRKYSNGPRSIPFRCSRRRSRGNSSEIPANRAPFGSRNVLIA